MPRTVLNLSERTCTTSTTPATNGRQMVPATRPERRRRIRKQTSLRLLLYPRSGRISTANSYCAETAQPLTRFSGTPPEDMLNLHNPLLGAWAALLIDLQSVSRVLSQARRQGVIRSSSMSDQAANAQSGPLKAYLREAARERGQVRTRGWWMKVHACHSLDPPIDVSLTRRIQF